jgi:hypothetical protein
MAQAAKPLKFFTAAEYLAWEEAQPERHELVEGVPYAEGWLYRSCRPVEGRWRYPALVWGFP